MTAKPNMLYCNCSYRNLVPDRRKRDVRRLLNGMDADLVAVPDLCELAARRAPELAALADNPNLTIIACHPRAVRWLCRWAGVPLNENARIINLRTADVETIQTQLQAEPHEEDPEEDLDPAGNWIPWFPVIDYDRCTNCKQCLSFCPFGVYSLDEDDNVAVTEPENCKNNCPACARVCPSLAIMFPKFGDRPINGDDVKPEDMVKAAEVREKQKADLAEKGIHSVLAKRKLQALMRRQGREPAAEDKP